MLALCFANASYAQDNYMQLADSADYYIARNNWVKAESYIVRALKLKPAYAGNSMLLSNLGVVKTHQHKYSEALLAYESALGIGRDSTAILNNRAYTFMDMNSPSDAYADLTTSLTIDSIQEWPREMRGLLRLRNHDLTGAEEDFSTLLSQHPGNEVAYCGLGTIAQERGDLPAALSLFSKAVDCRPTEENSLQKILVLVALDHINEAYEEARNAVKRFPREGNLFAALAYIYKLRYQYVEAEETKKIALNNGADSELIDRLFPPRSK